ncbi:hypothetical protein CAPTEDRAFT_199284 [Capitella teleta]|uniref:DDE-1 domain-containing protein n=1 Tax=Capitella teleta TaxID=283909 RepID=R7T460_CAPTE|nr:hypothetical protein CAPTEDRAFT_199284 [Capitella teleta]|eukprot:ELT87687.1 hypothetical protein CAPTEDRAFT_199284 [Capitella teleta]
MSLLRYFKIADKTPRSYPTQPPGLPDLNAEATPEDAAACAAANREILRSQEKAATSNSKKRGDYSQYDEGQRLKIARYTIDNGPAKASRHFSALLGKREKPGRPTFLPADIDRAVQRHLRQVRREGGVINRSVVLATGRGFIISKGHRNPDGSPVLLTRGWAASLITRMGYVQRKGTKASKKKPDDFPAIKGDFLDRFVHAARDIPPEMIVNFDQTGLSIVPTSSWTLAEKGAKQVEIVGLDDKRQITALLGCSLTGDLLPLQLIYTGKTDKCHPSYAFPDDWQELLASNNIRVIFVPACCTGDLQPLDLTGNGDFKASLKECFIAWFADHVAAELDNGISTQPDLRLSTLKPLHGVKITWMLLTTLHDVALYHM